MDLILFQVGESKETTDKHGNCTVCLTKKGAKTVLTAARGMARVIPRKVKLQVWSSVETPSSQTADYIAEELGVKRKFLRSIDSDDLNSFLETAFEYAKSDVLLIVSHHTNVTEWSKKLTGLDLPFVNASAAGLSIDPANPESGELQWFIQPRYLKNIN